MYKGELVEKKINYDNNPESSENQAKAAVLYEIFNRVYNMENIDEIVDFVDKIKEKYPDYATYRLYHLLIGSTLNSDSSTKVDKFDLPENEIENFLHYLDQKKSNTFSKN